MSIRFLLVVLTLITSFVGCGKQETILPTDPLTDAQKAAIKAEDDAIAQEESQGKLPKPKGGKKS